MYTQGLNSKLDLLTFTYTYIFILPFQTLICTWVNMVSLPEHFQLSEEGNSKPQRVLLEGANFISCNRLYSTKVHVIHLVGLLQTFVGAAWVSRSSYKALFFFTVCLHEVYSQIALCLIKLHQPTWHPENLAHMNVFDCVLVVLGVFVRGLVGGSTIFFCCLVIFHFIFHGLEARCLR